MPSLDWEKRLFAAADALRPIVARRECSFFTSIVHINNLYLLNLFSHVTGEAAHMRDKPPQDALYDAAHAFVLRERAAAPFAYMTPNAVFLDNMCQMLNTPFFEKTMSTPQSDPALAFMRELWGIYTDLIPRP